MNNEKEQNAIREGKKLRRRVQKLQDSKGFINWFEKFTKLIEVKVLYHKIEVCHMSL